MSFFTILGSVIDMAIGATAMWLFMMYVWPFIQKYRLNLTRKTPDPAPTPAT